MCIWQGVHVEAPLWIKSKLLGCVHSWELEIKKHVIIEVCDSPHNSINLLFLQNEMMN